MKKTILSIAVIAAAIFAASCQKENLQENTASEGSASVFTATIETGANTKTTVERIAGSPATYKTKWESTDQISINGVTYTATPDVTDATKATFTKDSGDDPTGTYKAYFPASLYDGTTATLPANINETWADGKYNMPMYAQSTTTSLSFKNLCAVLAIKVTSADITTLRSIKVTSDKKMNGSFTVTDNAAVVGSDGTNVVELKSSADIPLDETGTTFYIAIPAQEYNYLNIFLSADGTTYTQAMATKKASGLGTIARNTIYAIDYAKNATKLWAGNLFVADCNVGATSAAEYGGYYTWGGNQDVQGVESPTCKSGTDPLSGDDDTATKLWGNNWRMPTKTELEALINPANCDVDWTDNYNDTGIKGRIYTGKGAYASNSVFLPAAGYSNGTVSGQGTGGFYWSSAPNDSDNAFSLQFLKGSLNMYDKRSRGLGCSVRAVLAE